VSTKSTACPFSSESKGGRGLIATHALDGMSEAQTSTGAAVARLRLALDRGPDPRFDGKLIELGQVIAWR
jgi:hypothetical protein